jgi:putative transposase
MVNGFGWMYIVVVLDWYTKKIVGYYAGMQCVTGHSKPATWGRVKTGHF